MPRKALNDKGEERYKGNLRSTRSLVGRRIGERRREMGLTQMELGETIGVSRETISKYETGFLDVAAGDLPVLALKLRVPLMYFFQGLQEEPGWRVLAPEIGIPEDLALALAQTPDQLKEAYDAKRRYTKILDGMGELSHLEESMMLSYRRLSGDQQMMAYAMVLGLTEHASGAGDVPASRRVIAHGMEDTVAAEAPLEEEKNEDATVAKNR